MKRSLSSFAVVLSSLALVLVGCDEEAKKSEMLAKTQGDAASAAVAAAFAAPKASASASAAPETKAAPKAAKECASGADLVIDDPDLEAELRKKLGKLPKAGETMVVTGTAMKVEVPMAETPRAVSVVNREDLD